MIVLGRGESAEKVKEWLKVGAKVPGVIGFAVGQPRTRWRVSSPDVGIRSEASLEKAWMMGLNW